jgi:hypothetical protein
MGFTHLFVIKQYIHVLGTQNSQIIRIAHSCSISYFLRTQCNVTEVPIGKGNVTDILNNP